MSNSLHYLLLVLSGFFIFIADTTAGCINSLPLNLRAFPGTDIVLSSPGFPNGYENNMSCEWRITASFNYVVRLTATYVDIEHVAGCTKDYISIYDGNSSSAALLGEYCSYWCTPLESSGLQMFIRFVTDTNVTDEGFQLTYTAVRPPTVPQIILTAPSVEIPSSAAVSIATPDSSSSRQDLQLAIIGAVVAVVCVFGLLITVCYVVTVKKNTSARVGAMTSRAGGGLTRAGRRVAEDFVEYDNSLFMVPVPFPSRYPSAPPPAYSSDPPPTDSVESTPPAASDAGNEVSGAASPGNEASVEVSASPSTGVTLEPTLPCQVVQ
ncbi:procollagen C-endopeptidase enhancer 1-like isoform X1 [Pomacea canaliculata]|uniref:procollagen C-endopeptidase enhancer 1-like isoform X1 n=2 Tax=Pomacea canaliculata TaxID=400727 RepID=UPI000D72E54E|nr:procollagen C-endopeptidase enhancer 1-like isoform X1 [Pomacea canaliculata]